MSKKVDIFRELTAGEEKKLARGFEKWPRRAYFRGLINGRIRRYSRSLPPEWYDSMTQREKVLWMYRAANQMAEYRDDPVVGWITTGQFYHVGLELFRNINADLRTEGFKIVKKKLPGSEACRYRVIKEAK